MLATFSQRVVAPSARLQTPGMQARGVSSAKVSLDAIKQLRARTGAPIIAVRNALQRHDGDVDAALDHLRKLGAALVADRAHRAARDGLVALAFRSDAAGGATAAALHLGTETDFVARTAQFGALASDLARLTLRCAARCADGSGVVVVRNAVAPEQVLAIDDASQRLADTASALGEHVSIKRAATLSVAAGRGAIASYVHGATGHGERGRIGVLVAVGGDTDAVAGEAGTKGLFERVGRRAAMHIAAASPKFLRADEVPTSWLEKERAILMEAAVSESADKPKPVNVLERMVDGRLRKTLADVVLEEQEMMVEAAGYSGKARSVVKSIRDEAASAQLLSFVRFSVGESDQ